MMNRLAAFGVIVLLTTLLPAQTSNTFIRPVSIENDADFEGFDLMNSDNQQLFVLAEHWHNIRSVPKATLKILRYLHQAANVRILAIEQGQSAAMMINQYLATGDTLLLQQITRHTMFWGKENRAFFKQLRAFNQTLPETDRISVQSIDIEYKMESAFFVINQWLSDKTIPDELQPTLGFFKLLFDESKNHREQFDGLAVMFYFDKEDVRQLVDYTLQDLEKQPDVYRSFLGESYAPFATMITDMRDGLIFDYTNPNTNYKFRDLLIYDKFNELLIQQPNKGILCVIGMRHATKGSSIYQLDVDAKSPVRNRVTNIRVSALYNGSFMSPDLRRINFSEPKQLKNHPASLIRHDPKDPTFKSTKSFDYTLFINDDGSLTPFPKVYKGER